jgi:hypothetical protein
VNFADSLTSGQLGESLIAQWLRGRGWHVLPAYEKEIDNGKGPRLFMADNVGKAQLIAPDLLTMRDGKFRWIEAKHKSHFSWYGKEHRWVTGIDLRHFEDYCKVVDFTGTDVWLLFLHREAQAWADDIAKWGAPPTCPTGLFGNSLELLRQREMQSHVSPKWGPTGMVYWEPFVALKKLASLDDISPGLGRMAA